MATSTITGVENKTTRRSRKRTTVKTGSSMPANFGYMEKELDGFLDKIRDGQRVHRNQLALPGFEKFFVRG